MYEQLIFQSAADLSQGLLLAALLIPHLYKRVQTLRSLEKNAPGKLQAFTSFKSHEIQFRDKLRNCEDVILLDGYEGWALLSCDAGRDYWNTVMVSLYRLFIYYHFAAWTYIQFLLTIHSSF